jgi:hypothetical protein
MTPAERAELVAAILGAVSAVERLGMALVSILGSEPAEPAIGAPPLPTHPEGAEPLVRWTDERADLAIQMSQDGGKVKDILASAGSTSPRPAGSGSRPAWLCLPVKFHRLRRNPSVPTIAARGGRTSAGGFWIA